MATPCAMRDAFATLVPFFRLAPLLHTGSLSQRRVPRSFFPSPLTHGLCHSPAVERRERGRCVKRGRRQRRRGRTAGDAGCGRRRKRRLLPPKVHDCAPSTTVRPRPGPNRDGNPHPGYTIVHPRPRLDTCEASSEATTPVEGALPRTLDADKAPPRRPPHLRPPPKEHFREASPHTATVFVCSATVKNAVGAGAVPPISYYGIRVRTTSVHGTRAVLPPLNRVHTISKER